MARTARNSPAVAVAAVIALVVLVVAAWAYVFADQRRSSGGSGSAATTTSESSPASSSPTSDEGEWSMGDAREAFAGDGSRTLVLGDSTGNGNDEWVHLWANSAGLPIARWDTDTESEYVNESEETRIWSGAMFEATADYPLEHESIWPEQDPDLVLLSYGHFHESEQEATEALEELRADAAERVPEAPVVVVLQNPQAEDAGADTREAIADWAKESGLPTIDVAEAFEERGTPEDLRIDELNPSYAGSELWAQTVAEALADESSE